MLDDALEADVPPDLVTQLVEEKESQQPRDPPIAVGKGVNAEKVEDKGVGEQKLILNDLLIVLQNYNDDAQFSDLINDYESIKAIYDDVKITYEIGEPQAIEKDGMLMVVQSETSHVTMSDETLLKIIEVTEEVRNKHLNI